MLHFSKIDMYGEPIPYGNTVANRTFYVQYADKDYTVPVVKPLHFGDLGPVIKAEVGDVIHVYLRNTADIHVSIHPHGVLYNQTSDGMMEHSVEPGGEKLYVWNVPERAGPGNGTSKLWAYHSHVSESDIYKGLVGPLVIYSVGNIPLDESNEIFVKSLIDKPFGEIREEETIEFFPINGYIYGNLRGLNMALNKKYTWYLISFGDEEDVHAMHWHGNVVKLTTIDQYVDVVHLFPASFETVIMEPDAQGQWMYHCHTIEHFERGMYVYYNVT